MSLPALLLEVYPRFPLTSKSSATTTGLACLQNNTAVSRNSKGLGFLIPSSYKASTI